MSTRKHHRCLIKRLKEELPGVTVTLLRSRVHYVYEVAYAGQTLHHCVANSARDTDHAIDNSIKQIRRALVEKEAK